MTVEIAEVRPREESKISSGLSYDQISKKIKASYYLNKSGKWTAEEDSFVIDFVTNSSKQPFNKWADIARHLPGKTSWVFVDSRDAGAWLGCGRKESLVRVAQDKTKHRLGRLLRFV